MIDKWGYQQLSSLFNWALSGTLVSGEANGLETVFTETGFGFAAYSSLRPELACPLPLLLPGLPMAHGPASYLQPLQRSLSDTLPQKAFSLARSPPGPPPRCGGCSPCKKRPRLSM